MRGGSALLSEDSIVAFLIFHCISSEHNSALILLVLCRHLCIFNVAQLHEGAEVNLDSLAFGSGDDVTFALNLGKVECSIVL